MEVASTSETSANFYQTTRRNNPEPREPEISLFESYPVEGSGVGEVVLFGVITEVITALSVYQYDCFAVMFKFTKENNLQHN
jgi:hypothetical protein